MERFGDALDRLTKNLVSELLAAVRAAAIDQLAEHEPERHRPAPRRILRPSTPLSPASAEVRVREFEIPVGRPRRRPRRAAGSPAAGRPASVSEPKIVKFEVVPHPEQKNRRIVLTRLDTQ